MIEGSRNVMIGGAASSGGDSVASARNRGARGGGSSIAASANDSVSGGNAIDSNTDGSSVTGFRSTSRTSSSTDQSSSQGTSSDANIHVFKAQLQSPGGQPLGFEQVVILKAGTEEQVAGPFTTDETGSIGVVVSAPGQYDVQLVDDGSTHPPRMVPDIEVSTHLYCQFFADGVPAAGELVTITGNGSTFAVALGQLGELEVAADPGAYELMLRGQTFKAHTMTVAALQRLAGAHYQFTTSSELDETALEQARADRYSPAEREEANDE